MLAQLGNPWFGIWRSVQFFIQMKVEHSRNSNVQFEQNLPSKLPLLRQLSSIVSRGEVGGETMESRARNLEPKWQQRFAISARIEMRISRVIRPNIEDVQWIVQFICVRRCSSTGEWAVPIHHPPPRIAAVVTAVILTSQDNRNAYEPTLPPMHWVVDCTIDLCDCTYRHVCA